MIATSRAGGDLRGRAYALRMDGDLSIRQIALRLGVPRATVGEWVKGHGEARHHGDCALCGERFLASHSHARFCGGPCARKHHTVFGRLA